MSSILLSIALATSMLSEPAEDEADIEYPLGPQLRVLAEDAVSPQYRALVDRMIITELRAEWQRVETVDSAASFLEKHGGSAAVMNDPELRRAYQRRVEIREKFLEVMRSGFDRLSAPVPFDQGETAEKAGTYRGGFGSDGSLLEPVLPSPGAADQWPRFRGPTGQGQAMARNLPVEWDRERNAVWRAPLPGSGNSSPVIWNESIFLTTAEDEGRRRAVHCIAREDGRMLWTRYVPSEQVEPGSRPKNGHASATAVTDGERVIAAFGAAGIVCYDMQGNLQWHHELPGFRTTHGAASSPLLYQDSVIFIHDQNRAESIFLALDKRTGSVLWRGTRPKAMGWCTPVAVRVEGHDELLFAGGKRLTAYDPATGEELWYLDGPTREVVPTIVVGPRLIYSASGRNGPTLGVRPGGHGDVYETHLAWRTVRGGPHVPSPVYFEGLLFTVNDTGIATCLDAETGELVWQKRLGDRFSASPLVAEGRLYCCGESGTTYVLRAGETFEQLAVNDLESPILASPAALGERLFIRTEDELFCLED